VVDTKRIIGKNGGPRRRRRRGTRGYLVCVRPIYVSLAKRPSKL
jgi:hypothetical protein